MGKTQSKNEEIIIAQNGANNASPRLTDIEDRVDSNYLSTMVLIVCVVILYVYIAFQHYKKHTRKLFKKELVKSNQDQNV